MGRIIKKENMSEYDVIVIGAGPGGYVAPSALPSLGLKTAIVDKQWLGGVCLNVGCIPSKSLLKNADVAHTLRERGKEFGLFFRKPEAGLLRCRQAQPPGFGPADQRRRLLDEEEQHRCAHGHCPQIDCQRYRL
jgi:hypothetical protein